MPWLGTADRWWAPSRPALRSGLAGDGPRIVRLLSLVWWLVSHDERAFASGVLGAPVVDRVCCEVHMHARLMCTLIDNEREMRKIGTNMLAVAEHLYDKQSLIADDVSKALCALSHFSMRDIYTFYHPNSAALAAVSDQLSKATRAAMTVAPPPDYHAHPRRAGDAAAGARAAAHRAWRAAGERPAAARRPAAHGARDGREQTRRTRMGGSSGLGALRGSHLRTRDALDAYAASQARAHGVHAAHHTRAGVPRTGARVCLKCCSGICLGC